MSYTITPFGGWADLRIWLAILTFLVAAMTWMLWGKAWRKEPPGFVWRTFIDERGVPDGKLIVICHAVSVMTITTMVGWFTGRFPPYYVWISWDFIAIAGIFGSTYVSKKYYDAGGSTSPPVFGMPPGMMPGGPGGEECQPDTGPVDPYTREEIDPNLGKPQL